MSDILAGFVTPDLLNVIPLNIHTIESDQFSQNVLNVAAQKLLFVVINC